MVLVGEKKREWQRIYYHNKRQALIKVFGGKCQNKKCGSIDELEFAHIKPTKLSGEGRGQWARYYDVIRNPDCYTLLCELCHDSFDNGEGKVMVS